MLVAIVRFTRHVGDSHQLSSALPLRFQVHDKRMFFKYAAWSSHASSPSTLRSPYPSQRLNTNPRTQSQNLKHKGRGLVCRSQTPNNRPNADLSSGPDALYHELVHAGTIWSDRFAQAEYLEEGECRSF